MVHTSSRIELSQSALRNNLSFIRDRIGPHPRYSMVVKANAYGHGIDELIPMAQRCGVDHFSVAAASEAEAVRRVGGERCDVSIMGILYDEDLAWAVDGGIEFFVFDLARLALAAEVARELGRPARVHLEIETGGNRTGLAIADLAAAAKLLRKNAEHLELVGICTHLAGAETLAIRFKIERQLECFEEARREAARRGLLPRYFHVASSAAALSMPERTAHDLVRVGVASYGFWPSNDVYNDHLMRIGKARDNPLRRILTWKTDVMHTKPVGAGEFVGYGTAYQASADMRVAVIPLGYANGYPRESSNKGHVLIHGYRAPIVGLINMNLFMVDVTRIPHASVGDTVVLVGRQRNNVIHIASFSEFSSALNTEFVCRLPAEIPRAVVR